MWSLLMDFLASIAVEWRVWKWTHDPPLKGDPPDDPSGRQLILALLAVVVAFVLWMLWSVTSSGDVVELFM